jgi:hypothetical protein
MKNAQTAAEAGFSGRQISNCSSEYFKSLTRFTAANEHFVYFQKRRAIYFLYVPI